MVLGGGARACPLPVKVCRGMFGVPGSAGVLARRAALGRGAPPS